MSDGDKTWLIISYRHIDHLDAAYGKLLDTVTGSYEEAAEEARGWVANYSPVVVCGVIQP